MNETLSKFFRCFENPGALLLVVTAVLMTIGSVMVYSASGARAGFEEAAVVAAAEQEPAAEEFRSHHSARYFFKQLIWISVAAALGSVVLFLSMEQLERLAWPALAISVALLLAVSFSPFGVEAKGARRWLRLGPFVIQPSEFAKIGIVIFMAWFLAAKRDRIHSLVSGFLPSVGILAVFCGLIMLQKDFGTIVLISVVVMGMWILAQVKVRYLATLGALSIPILCFLVYQYPYRIRRILAFIYPEEYKESAYQLRQSLIAVGSSGITGPGLGEGVQKNHYLIESHTDFIYAVAAEELGLIGALSILLLYVAFIVLGLRISYKAPDYFSGLLAAGLTMIIGIAVFINLFVVLGLAPTKGIALPFLSYGGSSMLASALCAALLINIANYTIRYKGGEECF